MSDWKSKADWKDRGWKYVNAASTDITKTLARVKREMRELAEKQEQENAKKITQFRKVAR